MFTIDFTKPWLYKDIIYFNQGNLSTNNTLRCKLVTGGSDDFTGGSIACTFTTKDSIEISGFGKLVDAKGGIVDIVFPSNALVVGTNKLEVLVNRADGGVAQSPPVMYDIWQGLTTGNGIEAETNYPILIELINSTNEASNKANSAFNKVNSMITDITDAIDNAYRSANDADIATSKSYSKIEEVENAKVGMINKVDTEIANMKTQVNASTNTMTSKVDMKIADVDSAIASGTKDLEVKESRRDMDGVEHDTLKLRLESDLKKGKLIEETKEGTYLSFNDTVAGLVSDIEVFGNTVQDASNLANIKSSCIPNGDGTFKMSILSCGNNLCNNKFKFGELNDSDGNEVAYDGNTISSEFSVVKSGSTVIIKSYDNTSTYARMFEYDKSGKVVTSYSIASLGTTSKTLNENTKYIKLKYQGKQSNIKVQLEEGTVATPYTPYEETRCDIKLPFQLEKWDKLYFDKEENAWCVDKRTLTLNSDELKGKFILLSTGVNTVRFAINGTYHSKYKLKPYGVIYSNIVPYMNGSDDVCHGRVDGTEPYGAINFWIDKGISSIDLLNKYLVDSNAYVKAETLNPQKIVLPQSEQIKLNSFANKTHIYTISGDVDATVKATVSKSLASTVQANTHEINILNGKIENIQGLKESQDFTYETDKGYLVCKDTQNGVVKDLKVCGKSLVNKIGKCDSSKWSKDSVGSVLFYRQSINDFNFEIGKNYTIVVFGMSSNVNPSLMKIVGVNNTSAITGNNFVFNFTVNTREESATPYIHLYKKNMDVPIVESDYTNAKMVILDGDYTQKPPNGYFEGIASVGNGNEIEVLSRKEDGNLFIPNLKQGYIGQSTGEFVPGSGNGNVSNDTFIKVSSGSKYFFNFELNVNKLFNIAIFKYDINKKYIGSELVAIKKLSGSYIIPSNIEFVKIRFDKADTSECLISDFNIERLYFGMTDTSYMPVKQDKKPILFKDTDGTWKPVTELRGIDLNNCDTVDNGKYSVKTNKIVLNGDGDYALSTGIGTQTNTIMVGLRGVPFKKPTDDNIKNHFICSNANQLSGSQAWNDDIEGVSLALNGIVYVRISKSKATDLVSAKEYLKNNPIPLIYLTNEVKEYEVNPLDLESYDNETMISFGSGAIAPHASWKITSSLPNFVKELSNQIKQLQDQVYKTNVANFAVALNTLDTKLRLDRLEAPQM